MTAKPYHPVDERMGIAIKFALRELACVLDDDCIITLASAAGGDKTALLLRQELEARSPKKAEAEYQA
ncbi:hypothetical protein ACL00X_11165 [Aeromonas diversa]|uniref:hypothetical protein n=1 Tax=Aeromonas diversa TaxID=502790 RepID=UPI0039A3F58B